MKAAGLIIAIGLLLMGSVRADMLPPPPAQFAVSDNGSQVVRLSYPNPKDYKADAVLTVYAFDQGKNSYQPSRSFNTPRQELGQFMFVSNDGRFVFVASISFNAGLRVFEKGELKKAWKLEELLTPAEIKACAQTGSTLQWFEQGQLYHDRFHFSGPSTAIRGWGGSYSVMKGRDPSVAFDFTIDLAKLELKKSSRGTASP